MFDLLYRYLIFYRKAILPGIGIFYLNRRPASFSAENNAFFPPVFDIVFAEESTAEDLFMYEFIGQELGMDQFEAGRRFTAFAYTLKENLIVNKNVQLPGLGSLLKTFNGDIAFSGLPFQLPYLPTIIAERIVPPAEEHAILVGDTSRTNVEMQEILNPKPATTTRADLWWVYAIILAVIGIAAIAWYYMQYGTLR